MSWYPDEMPKTMEAARKELFEWCSDEADKAVARAFEETSYFLEYEDGRLFIHALGSGEFLQEDGDILSRDVDFLDLVRFFAAIDSHLAGSPEQKERNLEVVARLEEAISVFKAQVGMA